MGKVKHGMTGTKLYYKWKAMRERCSKTNHPAYHNYGGRGITVCKEWQNNFMKFYEWAVANGYSEELQLDRINNNKGYNPENCRFVTQKINDNNKRTNRYVTISGVTKTVTQWAEHSGISLRMIQGRVERGWADEDLLKPKALKSGNPGKLIEVDGKARTATKWAEISGLSPNTIRRRVREGVKGKDLLKRVRNKTSED